MKGTDSVTTKPSDAPRVMRNDYSSLELPRLGAWTPTDTVSVVVPAFQDQDKLDLVLAALAGQSYPRELIEVVVVDDGSEPPLEAPRVRPERTRVIPNRPGHWASASAVDTAIAASDGAIILRLDADVIPDRHHVEAHARWHHAAGYLTVMGHIAFVEADPASFDPGTVLELVADGRGRDLFDGHDVEYKWVIKFVEETDGLRDDERRAFSAANGASISFRRALYDASGGLDVGMRLGGDTELGFRLAQAGAVFVPDPDATAWHVGLSQMRKRTGDGARYRQPFLAHRVPSFRYMRVPRPGVLWKVPFVEIVVDASKADLEAVSSTVDSVLAGSVADVAVTLLGPWDRLHSDRNALLEDPLLDLRLIQETYSGDPRVRFASAAAADAAPVPFRLTVPAGPRLSREAVQEVTDLAEKRRVGRVRLHCEDEDRGEVEAVLDRTAALARARLVRGVDEPFEAAVESVWGLYVEDGAQWLLASDADGMSPVDARAKRLKEFRDTEREARMRADRWRKTGSRARAEAKEWERAAREWQQAAEWWEDRSKAHREHSGSLLRRAGRKLKRALRG
ncbi:Glycosyl transferase family 2 [Glycomyces sambucus]|uniref:Glycosyl transferase family 2 n=1 Tax=Glycomyces sambucus TaxID=380244 RepID=A0A1G9GYL1_9ACTN|nr:glycosyltransferase [Glycomyces sambucus]SDL05800.1 Glycosyl transferase family 2 [Glycomyces sambucus]